MMVTIMLQCSQLEEAVAATSNLRALLVLQHGVVQYDYYRSDTTPETLLHGRSITKSIVSALVGIAIGQGLIRSVHDKVLDFFPDYAVKTDDMRKHEITLDHLLTMTSGFAWDNDVSWYDEGAPAAVDAALDRPLWHAPGLVFNYDSPAVDLLTVILSRVAQKPARTYAAENLFHPLDITRFEWERDPAGYDRGSAGLAMRPMDVAKFGQLVLQQGVWNGSSIIPQDWLEESTRSRIRTPEGAGYGRSWWVEGEGSARQFSAIGYCAQYLTVIPRLALVVVANHDVILSESVADQLEHTFTSLILRRIIKAAAS